VASSLDFHGAGLGFAWLLLSLRNHGGLWLHGRSNQACRLVEDQESGVLGKQSHVPNIPFAVGTYTGLGSGWLGSPGMEWGDGMSF